MSDPRHNPNHDEQMDKRQRRRAQRMNKNAKGWTRSTIRSQPFVTNEVVRGGEVVRKRGVEEMLRMFNKRVQKSGNLQHAKQRQHYEKPSEARYRDSKRISYEIDKQNRRDKEIKRRRGDLR